MRREITRKLAKIVTVAMAATPVTLAFPVRLHPLVLRCR